LTPKCVIWFYLLPSKGKKKRKRKEKKKRTKCPSPSTIRYREGGGERGKEKEGGGEAGDRVKHRLLSVYPLFLKKKGGEGEGKERKNK